MYPLTISDNQELRAVARVFFEEFRQAEEIKIVPFKQIRKETGLSQDTITRRCKANGVKVSTIGKTLGGGKGISNKDYQRLFI